jgi:signal transduction histidine kinase/CheY-like chemotaxis protein/ligand-binding sensor domain-containing protein
MGPAEGLPCSTEVRTLFAAADGALWVNACAQVFRFDGQRFRSAAGLRGMFASTESMANCAGGSVVVATVSGLYKVAEDGTGTLSARPYSLVPELSGVAMHGIARHGSQLWFGCGQKLCVEDGGRLSMFGPSEGLPDDDWSAIAFTPDGSVWARSAARLYRKPPGAARLVREKPDITSGILVGAMSAGRDGSLMVPSDKGLAIHDAHGWRFIDEQRGMPAAMASAVLEDREGSLWIGLIGSGVARWLGYGEWEAWTKAQGLPSDLIWSIRRDRKGSLWVGTSLGVARLQGREPLRTWTRKDGLGDNVRWLGETSDGAIWAVEKPGGLARIDPTTDRVRLFGAADGLSCVAAHRGLVDHLDRLWVATACGIFRSDRPSAVARFHRIQEPAPLDKAAWALAEDKLGTMWITNPDGLWRLRDGQWRVFGKADGLLSGNPYIPLVAADGALWLRHRMDGGIERVEFSGDRLVRSTPIVPVDLLSVDVTAFHGFDASGHFWRGGADGVSVLAEGTWRHLGTEDGLIWNDTDGEAFWADSDGSVWIGTSGGLAHYRPPQSGSPAPVADPIITGLEIGQKSRALRAEFSTLGYKREQLVRFAYRMDGERWNDTTDRSISIAGLTPGRHRLEVRSRVRDGPVSPNVAMAEFSIQPKWWENWWLRALFALIAAAAASWFIRWRSLLLLKQRTAELDSERIRMLEEKRCADAAVEAKGRFLANMSHEIRTPLNGVIGQSLELEAMAVPPEALEVIRMIRSSGDALLRVISDVLDFSKAEAGKLELDVAPFDLHRCLQEGIRLFRPGAAEKGLRLACELSPDLPVWVAGDGTRLRQVVLNLVSNAVKFTRSGEIVLAARLERQDETSSSIVIEVRDTGIGIAQDQLPRLFSSFSQADSSISRRYGGTGLGLAISKRLVEVMGGTIHVESKPGEGTRFWFTVLLGHAQSPAASSVRPEPELRAGNLRVLVAEDNLVNQRVVLKLLEKLGVHADLAVDGSQAIAAVADRPYDLVLMDVQMPEVDGLSATRAIRSRLPADRQPAIFGLTAHATEEYRDVCLDAGMDGFLTKPLEREKLRALIAELSIRAVAQGLRS